MKNIVVFILIMLLTSCGKDMVDKPLSESLPGDCGLIDNKILSAKVDFLNEVDNSGDQPALIRVVDKYFSLFSLLEKGASKCFFDYSQGNFGKNERIVEKDLLRLVRLVSKYQSIAYVWKTEKIEPDENVEVTKYEIRSMFELIENREK